MGRKRLSLRRHGIGTDSTNELLRTVFTKLQEAQASMASPAAAIFKPEGFAGSLAKAAGGGVPQSWHDRGGGG